MSLSPGRDRSIPDGSPRTSSSSGSNVPGSAFLAALRARNVLMVEYPHGQVRAVTHHGIDASDIQTILAAVSAVLRETTPAAPGTH